MDDIDKIESILKSRGAKLVRTKKHKVWRFPDGRIWVVSGTPSDDRSYRNNYHDLCNFLGIDTTQRKNQNRKPKQGVGRAMHLTPSGVRLREMRTELASVRMYCRPVPQCYGMWKETLPCTPLTPILGRLLS